MPHSYPLKGAVMYFLVASHWCGVDSTGNNVRATSATTLNIGIVDLISVLSSCACAWWLQLFVRMCVMTSTLLWLRAHVRDDSPVGPILGTPGDHLGPLGTIWGPSGTWIRWSYRFHYGIGPSGVRGSIRLVFRSTDARILWKIIHIKKSNIQKEWKKIKNGENRHGIINPL